MANQQHWKAVLAAGLAWTLACSASQEGLCHDCRGQACWPTGTCWEGTSEREGCPRPTPSRGGGPRSGGHTPRRLDGPEVPSGAPVQRQMVPEAWLCGNLGQRCSCRLRSGCTTGNVTPRPVSASRRGMPQTRRHGADNARTCRLLPSPPPLRGPTSSSTQELQVREGTELPVPAPVLVSRQRHLLPTQLPRVRVHGTAASQQEASSRKPLPSLPGPPGSPALVLPAALFLGAGCPLLQVPGLGTPASGPQAPVSLDTSWRFVEGKPPPDTLGCLRLLHRDSGLHQAGHSWHAPLGGQQAGLSRATVLFCPSLAIRPLLHARPCSKWDTAVNKTEAPPTWASFLCCALEQKYEGWAARGSGYFRAPGSCRLPSFLQFRRKRDCCAEVGAAPGQRGDGNSPEVSVPQAWPRHRTREWWEVTPDRLTRA